MAMVFEPICWNAKGWQEMKDVGTGQEIAALEFRYVIPH